MPDTGAPWNIPYVESSDLVSDWPADSLALANAIDAGLDAAGNAGIGSNVVQTIKTDTFTTTSTSYTDITGLSVNITPSSATSKVLVIASMMHTQTSTGANDAYRLVRDSTSLSLGDTASNRTRATIATSQGRLPGTGQNADNGKVSTLVVLDSPATTSAVNYHIEVSTTGTFILQATANDADLSSEYRGTSSITAIEVAA